MEEIKEKKVEKQNNVQGSQSNQFSPKDDNREYITNIEQDFEVGRGDKASPFIKRIKREAWCLILVGVLGLVGGVMTHTSGSVNESPEADQARDTHMSTTLTAGTKLLSADDNYIGTDVIVEHSSKADETNLHIWDYAAEDGDYVQVFVNEAPLGAPFMIKNKPVTFKVPTVGDIKVVGTRDGGGGITYAVYYDMNHTTYFNGVDEGGNNLYQLIRK